MLQLAYAIGVAEPVSINVNVFGTGTLSEEKITAMIRKVFPLKPGDILRELKLKQPIYKRTASNGHFGAANSPGRNWTRSRSSRLW